MPDEEAQISPPRKRRILAFAGVTLLLILVLIEGLWHVVCALGLLVPPSGDRTLDKEWSWVITARAKGSDPNTQGPYQWDPFLGWGLRPNFAKDNIHINANGQRGLVDWPKDRQPGKRRILIVGDSYTYGYDVGDSDCYAYILGNRYLPDAEVINWGVPGYGIDQQLLIYEKHGVEFSPDVVVMGFYTPDLFRNNMRFYNYIKPMFDLEGGELKLAEEDIPSPTQLLHLYASGGKKIRASGSYLVNFVRRELEDIRRDRVDESTLEWPVTEKILERFSAQVRKNGATPFLLIIPDRKILKAETSASTDTARLLSSLAERLGMPCLDLVPVLREKAKTEPVPLYKSHFTPKGHEVAAEALYEALKKAGLLSASSRRESLVDLPLIHRYA